MSFREVYVRTTPAPDEVISAVQKLNGVVTTAGNEERQALRSELVKAGMVRAISTERMYEIQTAVAAAAQQLAMTLGYDMVSAVICVELMDARRTMETMPCNLDKK